MSNVYNVYDLLQTEVKVFKKLSFKDLLFVHYRCPQLEKYATLYTHHNYIVYALKGKKTYYMPGKSILLKEGSCAFVKKGGYTQERFFDMDWIVLAFFMPDKYLQQFVKEYRTLFPPLKPGKAPLEVFTELRVNEITKAFFDGILPYFLQETDPPESVIELKFRELLLNLLSDPANNSLLHYFVSLADTSKPLLQEVMEDNFTYNLSLDEFARIAQRSLAAFKREFVEVYKMPPGKWLTEKRLEYAQHLLNTSQKSVNEIASDSGFESPSHFSRIFKEKFRIAPLQYRKQLPVG